MAYGRPKLDEITVKVKEASLAHSPRPVGDRQDLRLKLIRRKEGGKNRRGRVGVNDAKEDAGVVPT